LADIKALWLVVPVVCNRVRMTIYADFSYPPLTKSKIKKIGFQKTDIPGIDILYFSKIGGKIVRFYLFLTIDAFFY